MLHKYLIHNFQIYSEKELSPDDQSNLIKALKTQDCQKEEGLLSGRGSIKFAELANHRSVAIKKYLRGGLLGRLIRKHYLKIGKLRPQIEHELLLIARNCGIKAPEPYAFVVKGGFFYQAWLVMERIESHDNLANISLSNAEVAQSLMPEVCGIIKRLVDHMIWHPDLHPGNFLLTKNKDIFLIDFDKAGIFTGPPSKLKEMYLLRWRRAVIKHNLPDFLSEHVSATLRAK